MDHCCKGEVARCLFKPDLGWKMEVRECKGQRPVEDSRPGERVNQGTEVNPSVEEYRRGGQVGIMPAGFLCQGIATLQNPSLRATPR